MKNMNVKGLLAVIKQCNFEGNMELYQKALDALAAKNEDFEKELNKVVNNPKEVVE